MAPTPAGWAWALLAVVAPTLIAAHDPPSVTFYNQALAVLGEVHAAVSNWRQVALGPEVGLRAAELDDFAPAFEHEQMDAAAALLGR